jgi:hypothetical protein
MRVLLALFMRVELLGQFFPMGNEKSRPFRTALVRAGGVESGGAGIRTPVRDKIDHSVYVRVPLIEVSSRWPMDSPLLDKSFLISPTT